jgi:membrane protease YdiL (CAAX protease family)
MKKLFGRYTLIAVLILVLLVGQGISFLANPNGWHRYIANLGNILGMIAFWGPIIALISSLFVWVVMHLLGFESLDSVRQESVEQNNPTPAIIFVGTLIASVLFLMLVIKP